MLGFYRSEDLRQEPLRGQRPLAALAGLALLGLLLVVLIGAENPVTGGEAVAGGFGDRANVEAVARLLFSRYVFAFEVTALLLTIAVVGAVVLARRPPAELDAGPDSATGTSEDTP
jgi:NADH-quinone oxidoreductase subunit J